MSARFENYQSTLDGRVWSSDCLILWACGLQQYSYCLWFSVFETAVFTTSKVIGKDFQYVKIISNSCFIAFLPKIKVDNACMLNIIKTKILSHRLLEIKITKNLGIKDISSSPRIKKISTNYDSCNSKLTTQLEEMPLSYKSKSYSLMSGCNSKHLEITHSNLALSNVLLIIPEFCSVTLRFVLDALNCVFYKCSSFCHLKIISKTVHNNIHSLFVSESSLLVLVFIVFQDQAFFFP